MKKETGFTLIELMITVALLAIAMGIGVPSYQSLIRGNKLDNAENIVNKAIAYGKNTAIAYNQALFLTTSKNTLIFRASSLESAEIINQVAVAPSASSQIQLTTDNTPIIFNTNGTIQQANGLDFCINGQGKSIDLNVTLNLNGSLVNKREDLVGSCRNE